MLSEVERRIQKASKEAETERKQNRRGRMKNMFP